MNQEYSLPKIDIYGWQTATDLFIDALKQLRDHIEEHDLYENNETDVIYMDHAFMLYEQLDRSYLSLEWEEHIYQNFMSFLTKWLRHWWC